MRTKIACEILSNIGADIEDRMEVYREAASAASGQLQAFRQVETFLVTSKKNKSLDKATLKVVEKEICRQIRDSERHMMGNASKAEAYKEIISYLKLQHDNFVREK